jgi:hypothetical protein
VATQPAEAYFSNAAPSTAFDETYWNFTLPLLVQDNIAIRYANTAVHTLVFAKSHTAAHAGKAYGTDYYGEALMCYGLALQEARRVSTGETDLREAVICCMFFAIFETINGDRDAAQAHLQSGQKILEELGHECNGSGGFRLETQNVLQYLAQQFRESGINGYNQYGDEEGGSILDTLQV